MSRRRDAHGAGAAGDDLPDGDLRDVDLLGWDERLADWVDGRMSERDRERFEAELRVNPQLRSRVDAYERLVGTVRAALRAPTHRTSLADRVLAAVAVEAQRPAHTARSWWPFVWAAASAAALLGLAVLVDSWRPPAAKVDVATAEPGARSRAADQDAAPVSAVEETTDRAKGDGRAAERHFAGAVEPPAAAQAPAAAVAEETAPAGDVAVRKAVAQPGELRERLEEKKAERDAQRPLEFAAGASPEPAPQAAAGGQGEQPTARAAAGSGEPPTESAVPLGGSVAGGAPTPGAAQDEKGARRRGAAPPPAGPAAPSAPSAAAPQSDRAAREQGNEQPAVGDLAGDVSGALPEQAKSADPGAAAVPTEFVALLTVDARRAPPVSQPADRDAGRGAAADDRKDEAPRAAFRSADQETTRAAEERRLRDDLQRFFRRQLDADVADAIRPSNAGMAWSSASLRIAPYAPLASTAASPPPRADSGRAEMPSAEPAPATERWWLVEGTQADLTVLLAELRRFADAPQRSWRAGEIEVLRAVPSDRVVRAQAGAEAPAGGAADERAPERRRMVLRFRVRE